MPLRLLVFISVFTLMSCKGQQQTDGKVSIRNDLLDKEFNKITIDEVIAGGARLGFRKTLSPGQSINLPQRNVESMRFTRRHKDHTKVYLVSCPKDRTESLSINLIDVHSNRLGGGCELNKRGEIRNGSTKWED